MQVKTTVASNSKCFRFRFTFGCLQHGRILYQTHFAYLNELKHQLKTRWAQLDDVVIVAVICQDRQWTFTTVTVKFVQVTNTAYTETHTWAQTCTPVSVNAALVRGPSSPWEGEIWGLEPPVKICIANCGQSITDSVTVATDSPQELSNALSNATISDPIWLPPNNRLATMPPSTKWLWP